MALGRHAWSSGKRIKGREQCHEMPGPASHRKGRGKWQQSVGPLWGACSLVAPCEKLKVGLGRDPTKERGALLGGEPRADLSARGQPQTPELWETHASPQRGGLTTGPG